MLTASNKAIEKLQQKLVTGCAEMGIGFKIFVQTDESGKENFNIKIAKQPRGDEVLDLHSIKMFLDPTSAAKLENYELDYLDEPDGGFLLRNRKSGRSK
jgi:Fe-S cluster assembly iron-binding protein IscA